MDSNRKQYKSKQRSRDVRSTASEGLLGNGRRGADAPKVLLLIGWPFCKFFKLKYLNPRGETVKKYVFFYKEQLRVTFYGN